METFEALKHAAWPSNLATWIPEVTCDIVKMLSRVLFPVFFILLAAFLWLIVTTQNAPPSEGGNNVRAPVAQLQSAKPAPKTSWLILPTLPPSATEADGGAEIYRLVCRDCHGDKGQGLTDEWRSTWAPGDQNCWQSKCHAGNHPWNGFDLPRYVPAIIGPTALARFEEAADLQQYIKVKMPWHEPGSLTDREYWQLTAFIVRENGGELVYGP